MKWKDYTESVPRPTARIDKFSRQNLSFTISEKNCPNDKSLKDNYSIDTMPE